MTSLCSVRLVANNCWESTCIYSCTLPSREWKNKPLCSVYNYKAAALQSTDIVLLISNVPLFLKIEEVLILFLILGFFLKITLLIFQSFPLSVLWVWLVWSVNSSGTDAYSKTSSRCKMFIFAQCISCCQNIHTHSLSLKKEVVHAWLYIIW